MHIIVGALGGLQIAAGLLTFFASRSAIHETLSATLFGMGVLALAASAAISELKGLGERIDAREAGDIIRHKESLAGKAT